MIEDVLETAFHIKSRNWAVLQRLVPLMCELPQAHCVQPSSILAWLQLALARPSQQVTAALCSWLDREATQPSIALAMAAFSGSAA